MSDLKQLTDVQEHELKIAGRDIDLGVRRRGDSKNIWSKKDQVTER
jgi:hypothetical protein